MTQSVEFELSCSQDPDAGGNAGAGAQQGEESQRKRRKKASIASRSILV